MQDGFISLPTMTNFQKSENTPEGWPGCNSEQVQVMLLGTYHMDNPGLDEINPEVDDVLLPQRQQELQTLTDRLARWNPHRIAVERPYARADDLNTLYNEYRSGKRSYDHEEEIDPVQPFRSDPTAECRSEVIQIAFRLADRLNHEQVYPIDCPAKMGNDEFEKLEERGFQPEDKTPISLPDTGTTEQDVSKRITNSTILESLRWQNQEEELRSNHKMMFGRYLRWGEEDNYGGPRNLSIWYDRNLRMAHNLWRAVKQGDERMLLVEIGRAHV